MASGTLATEGGIIGLISLQGHVPHGRQSSVFPLTSSVFPYVIYLLWEYTAQDKLYGLQMVNKNDSDWKEFFLHQWYARCNFYIFTNYSHCTCFTIYVCVPLKVWIFARLGEISCIKGDMVMNNRCLIFLSADSMDSQTAPAIWAGSEICSVHGKLSLFCSIPQY